MHSSEAPANADAPQLTCQACGHAGLDVLRVQTALWEDERLVVVEDVPALVCPGCGERFHDDETAMRLDMLRGTGFPADRAARVMSVEVFRLSQTLPRAGARRDV